jgi:hypothetical protein
MKSAIVLSTKNFWKLNKPKQERKRGRGRSTAAKVFATAKKYFSSQHQ